MNKIVSFIKQAGELNLTAKDIQPLLKKATGHDVPEHEIQKVLDSGGHDGSQGSTQHHGAQPGGDPGAGAPPGGDPSAGAPDLSGISPMPSDGSSMAPPMGGDPSQGGGAPPIDPQELAALQQQFPSISPEDLAAISQAIEEYLAQSQGGGAPSPDAGGAAPPPGAAADAGAPAGAGAQGGMPPMPPMPPKQGSFEEPKGIKMVKSAAYIYGFLENAIVSGFSVKQAIDLYGEAYENTTQYVKQAAEAERLSANLDDKTASYFEGIVEQADARGLNFDQTVALLKQSGVYEHLLTEMTKETAGRK